MNAKRLLTLLKLRGCQVLRQRGSHVRARCGKCFTTIPVHPGEDLGIGLLKAIERDLEPCFGKRMDKIMKRYIVTYERGSDGWWVASIPKLKGCHTQGRSIRQARWRIREAIGLFVNNTQDLDLVDDIKLPSHVVQTVDKLKTHRKFVEAEYAKGQKLAVDAVQLLTEKLHLSCRDASEILQISHQRIQQLASPSK